MIYFDNAATSWPKPPGVAEAMVHFLEEVGANPGRSGHRLSLEAERIVYEIRELIAQLVNARDPLRVVFGPNLLLSSAAARGAARNGRSSPTLCPIYSKAARLMRSAWSGWLPVYAG